VVVRTHFFVNRRLGDHHLHALLLKLQEVTLSQLHAPIHIVYLSIVEETLETPAAPIVSYHLEATRSVGDSDGRGTHSSKCINNELGLGALACYPLADWSWRSSSPGLLIKSDAFVEPFEESVPLNPVLINVGGRYSLFATVGSALSEFFLEGSRVGRKMDGCHFN
jgi:hypothetical protein